jgi:hypothetical protein
MTPRPILAGAAVVLALIAGAIWVILKVLLIGMPLLIVLGALFVLVRV